MPKIKTLGLRENSKKRNYTPSEINRIISEAYIGLGDTRDIQVTNGLLENDEDYESPVHEILDFMRKPNNFAYTCRHLLNIELLPFQIVILRELWRRKFPMLIASRGGSKTWLLSLYALLRSIFDQGSKVVVVGAAFRQSKKVQSEMWIGATSMLAIPRSLPFLLVMDLRFVVYVPTTF
jgi:hypothetical protein